jgi:hypothetical protein
LLLIISDAFLKRYVTVSSFSDSAFYHPFLYTMLLVFLVSAFLLLLHFKRSGAGEEIWHHCTEASSDIRHQKWIILGILLIGIFLRFWNLTGLFDGVYHDEAYSGLDGIAIRYFGERPVFLNWNAGGEALVAYLVAASSFIFHNTTFAVRTVEATAGCLTLVLFYLFLKETFNSRLALLGLFLLAFSKHHLIYSRFGIWVNLVPLFELATLYFLRRGLKSVQQANLNFIIGGLIAGLGFYTYIAYRIFPLVAIAFLLDPANRKLARKHLSGLTVAFSVCCLILLPITVYFLRNPSAVTNRMEMISIWQIKRIPLPYLLADSVRWTLGMFTFIGDSIPRHNVLSEPMLSPFTTAFFWIGILLSIANIHRPFGSFILVYFAVGLLPGIFSIQAPHAGRALAALPPALIFCSLGLIATIRFFSEAAQSVVRLFLLIVLSGVLITGPNDALFRYSNYLDSYEPLTGMGRLESNVAQLVRSQGTDCQFYLSPQLFFHASVEYLSYPHPVQKLYVRETKFDPGKIAIVLFVTEPRYLWWITDDDRKNYFKWWHQAYGYPIPLIRQWTSEFYDPPPGYKRSDAQILIALKQQHPDGHEVRFDHFSAFVFKP